MKEQKQTISARQVRRRYAVSVFLDYAARHPGRCADDYPRSFERELDVGSSAYFSRRLVRAGCLERSAEGGLTVTEAGRRRICPDDVRFYGFASAYTDICAFEEEKARRGGADFAPVLRAVLLRELERRTQAGDYAAACNLHRDIAALCAGEGDAAGRTEHLLEALCLQTSGLRYYDALTEFIRGRRTEKSVRALYKGLYLPPQLLSALAQCTCTAEQARAVFARSRPAINFCSEQSFAELAGEITGGTYENDIWQKRFSEAFDHLIEAAKEDAAKRPSR